MVTLPVSLRNVFYALALGTILAASFRSTGERFIWTLFGVAFLVAADKIKDVERAKAKERDLTEIRMQKQMLVEFEASLGSRYAFTTEQIGNAFEKALAQLSTYVKDASPTRSANLRITNEDDDRPD